MIKFTIGVVVGIVLSAIGFDGMAHLGNRTIEGIQSFANSTVK